MRLLVRFPAQRPLCGVHLLSVTLLYSACCLTLPSVCKHINSFNREKNPKKTLLSDEMSNQRGFLWETPLFLCTQEWVLREKPLDAAQRNIKAFRRGIHCVRHARNCPFFSQNAGQFAEIIGSDVGQTKHSTA